MEPSGTSAIRVRPAEIGDLFWLRLLLGQLMESLPEAYPAMTLQDLEVQTAIMAARLGGGDPSLLCFVAEQDHVIGGFVRGDIMVRTGTPRRYCFTDFFYVVPPWRGTGTGRRLAAAMIQAAGAAGAEAMEFIGQRGDPQWSDRGWPVAATLYSLPIDAALASVVRTHGEHPNGHAETSTAE